MPMEFVSVDQLRSKACHALWDWYQARRGDDEHWPPRDSFRPEDMPAKVLPHLGVVDVERQPFRVCYRLIGSAIAESLGRSSIKGYLDTLGLPQEEELESLYREAISADHPLFLAGEQEIDGEAFIYEGGALPLGDRDDSVRRFIIFEDFLRTDAWRSALRRRHYRPNAGSEKD
ncbi:MAG: hypothetical protein Tsb0032_10540 [Kiloniellaceae bacterium]